VQSNVAQLTSNISNLSQFKEYQFVSIRKDLPSNGMQNIIQHGCVAEQRKGHGRCHV